MISFEGWFSTRHANIPVASAKAVLALAEGGATLPFIARYRKEQTGNLDEVAIQAVLDAKEAWDAIEHRKKFICDEIEKQGKLIGRAEGEDPRDLPSSNGSRTSTSRTSRSGRPRR